ncbi:MAG: hypothetical protein QXO73_07560 [Archaeoglobaceae archaeon]
MLIESFQGQQSLHPELDHHILGISPFGALLLSAQKDPVAGYRRC